MAEGTRARSPRAHDGRGWRLACLTAVVVTFAVAPQPETVQPARAGEAPDAKGSSRITRVEIERIESPAFDGRAFGSVGQYKLLLGRAFGEVDPSDPHSALIVNLQTAPRNAQGKVEYSADFRILKPVDMSRGNRTLFYDVPNRGAQRAFILHQDFGRPYGSHPVRAADLGDGFLMEQGYTVVWSGWQGDVVPGDNRLTARFPVAMRPDGSPIRKWVTAELPILAARRSTSFDAELVQPYPAVAESMPKAMLYRRKNPDAAPELLSRDLWSFATCEGTGPPVPSLADVCMPTGFSPDFVYYLVYEATSPTVMGMAFPAIRDFVSFLRYNATDMNPLVSRRGAAGGAPNLLTTAIMFGVSQPGRLAKDFIYEGFNRDTAGRRVFDGAIPATSGSRRTFTNFEFAGPGRFSRNIEDHYAPGDQFPFTYETLTDPVTGRVDGLLARCRLTETCPKVMHFDSANEMWSARGSLVVTDGLGLADVPIPDNVRIYQFSGTQHQGGTGAPPATDDRGICQQRPNPGPYREAQRALVVAMQAWVTTGALPPPSQYSKLSDGTLVRALPQSEVGFPTIPGVRYTGEVNDLFVNDYSQMPPRHTTQQYTLLVPKVDRDGNDRGGVRSTMVEAPIATYTGWNLRRAGYIEDEGCALLGSYIPFARTAADRGADPRPSLEERYGSQAAYVAQVRAAAARLQKAGFLLPQDAQRVIREAEQRELGLPGDR